MTHKHIDSPLPIPARDATVVELQAMLVDLIDLALLSKQAHWNVTGPSFRSVHHLLDDVTDAYRAWSDEVAERITALGIAAEGSADRIAQTTRLEALPKGYLGDQQALSEIAGRIRAAATRGRERLERVAKTDPLSEDLLVGICRGLEKQAWMFEAQMSAETPASSRKPTQGRSTRMAAN